MPFGSYDEFVAAVSGDYERQFFKASATAVAGFIHPLFRLAAGDPAASSLAVPTTAGRVLDRTQPGAIPLCAAGSGKELQLSLFQIAGPTQGNIGLYDRIIEWGGASGIVTGAQLFTNQALPARYTDGQGIGIWMEWYTATGSTTSANATVSYTNQDGVSGRTATLVGGTPASVPAGRTYQLALQAGDTGVWPASPIQSVNLGTSTGTAGNFGVTLRKLINIVPNPTANLGQSQGWAETGLTVIPTDACLELLVQATTTSTGTLFGKLGVVQAPA